jgi:hypothetical protein
MTADIQLIEVYYEGHLWWKKPVEVRFKKLDVPGSMSWCSWDIWENYYAKGYRLVKDLDPCVWGAVVPCKVSMRWVKP